MSPIDQMFKDQKFANLEAKATTLDDLSKCSINYKDSLRGDQGDAFDAIRMFIDNPVGGMFLLDGFAGTGKTYLMNVVIQYIGDVTKREILVTAPTHKAVKVIRQHVHDSRVDFATVHSALGLKEHIDAHGKISFVRDNQKRCKLDRIQFLIVDETSMLADELYEEIQIYASRGLKVLFVGDSLQIPPVNKPDSIPFDRDYRAQDDIGYTKMETIIRQDAGNPIIDHSFKIREMIYRPDPVPIKKGDMTKQGSIQFVPRSDKDRFIITEILPEYTSEEFIRDNDHVKILAWRNKTVDTYNTMIRHHIYQQKDLAKYLPGERLIAMEPLMEDDAVVMHNSEEMEIMDYEIKDWDEGGKMFKYYNTHVNVFRDGEGWTEFMIKLIHEDSERDYNDLLKLQANYAKSLPRGSFQARSAWIDFYAFKRTFFWVRYSYSVTCHKSQGSTYNIAIVDESDIDMNHNTYEKNRILYTACTRPREHLIVIF